MEDKIFRGSMKKIYEEDAVGYARYVNLLMAGLDDPVGFSDEIPKPINDGDSHKPVTNETEIQRLPSHRTTKTLYIVER